MRDPKTPALSLVGLGAAAVYVLGLASGRPGLCLAAKPMPVLCLALWTLARPGRYARLLAVGLLVSMTADVAIEWSFLAGLGLFLLAHLVYVAAFLVGHPPLRPLRALPVLAALGFAYRVVAPGLGSLKGAVVAYMAAIGTMVWRAAARVGPQGPARAAAWSGLLGAVLFAASDTLIALDRFKAPIPGARYAIILLYWAGQLGIALSARAGD
jgi:alkenylglycerophosphocholine/alkenylglycerophosphoethanolamine hydrolase